MEKTENIVILGAGPAGISTALFLAKAGISPVVLERSNFPRDKVCGDALSGKVVEVLKKINPEWVDDLAAQPAHLGSWGVSFFAPDRNCLRVPFRRTPKPGENAPGYIAKRIDFDNWWFQKAVNEPLISIRQNVHPNSFVKTSEGWIISDEKGDEIVRTKLIIAADGALSKFAKNPGGIHMEPRHYCAGIRAYYKNVKDCDSENFIELHFLKDLLPGYFWIFPLPNGLCNVGIGMRSDTIASKKLNLKKELQKILTEDPVFKARFSESEILGPVQGFGLPLGSKKRNISGEGFMLTGDAASLIDPFTGEGIGNAMMSGMLAAKIGAEAIHSNDFSKAFLGKYDVAVYSRLWQELNLSRKMQSLVKFPWLFNLVVRKAKTNKELSEMISCMFEDLDLRDKLQQPGFYFRLIFGK